eukprot:gene16035-22172_t
MYQLAILALSLLSPMAASYRPLDTVESAAVMDKSAGARVVPILFDLEMHELDKMFSMVNGILIPGGNYDLSTETTWFKAAEHLFKLVKAANDKGDRVVLVPLPMPMSISAPPNATPPLSLLPTPLGGGKASLASNVNANAHAWYLKACLGFELLVTLLTRTGDALVKLDAYNHPAPITFSPHSIDSSWVRQIPQDVQANLETHPISMHNHHYGFLPQTWDDYSNLRDFFMPVAHSYDRQGIAFHPEKVPFEWTTEIDIPHSRMANDAAYALAQVSVGPFFSDMSSFLILK